VSDKREGQNRHYFSLATTLFLPYDLTGKNRWPKESNYDKSRTTRMSSKGQVVIPEDIRKKLKLKAGSQFVVLGEDDVVILKAISPPSVGEFNGLIAEVRRQAKAAGLKRSDIAKAITRVRAKK